MSVLTKEEEVELEGQITKLTNKLMKKLMGPLFRLFGGQIALAGWLVWLTWSHTAAAVLWTVAAIVWIVGWGCKFQKD